MIASRDTKFFIRSLYLYKINLNWDTFFAQEYVNLVVYPTNRIRISTISSIKLERRFHWDNIMLKFERYIFEPYFCFYIHPTVVVDCLKVKILFVCTAWFTESYKLASYLFAKDKLNAKMKSGFWSKRIYLRSLDNALLIINKSHN